MVKIGTLLLAGISFSLASGTDSLPAWQPGHLDIHHISTGRGNATFCVLPDGTTLLIDAGAAPDGIPQTEPRPDATRTPAGWIVDYVRSFTPAGTEARLDYALLTHFHSDHMGSWAESYPVSRFGDYRLSGITEVAEYLPIGLVLDRGWPDYDFPRLLQAPYLDNYRRFLETRRQPVEPFRPGAADQITLRHDPGKYFELQVRNLAANGEVWTGVGDETRRQFPPLESLSPEDTPTENMCSLALPISYGLFDYFTGGDLPGVPDAGAPSWHDLESPIARAIGPTEVAAVNHHGSIDPSNAFFLATLRPRVHVIPAWAPGHPAPSVLKRLLSPRAYPGPRDVFATHVREAARVVIGRRMAALEGKERHIVVRVEPGDERFQVFVLDDGSPDRRLLGSFGPYPSN